MKLSEVSPNALRARLRSEVSDVLAESVVDFLGSTLAKLKHQHPEETFSEHNPEKVSLEDVAKIITALRVISNRDYRTVITKDDVGINPNSAREVFNLLDSIKKSGKNEGDVTKIIGSLASLAPSVYRKEMEKLKVLKQDDDEKRKEALTQLEQFMLKSSQLFQKLKTGVEAK